MLNENAKKWIAALRSGEYKQTKDKLRGLDGYCCLGVACELAAKAGIIADPVLDDRNGWYLYQDSKSKLPTDVREWIGLNDGSGCYGNSNDALTADNDDGKTFLEIADIIESEPEGLFVNDCPSIELRGPNGECPHCGKADCRCDVPDGLL